MPKAAWMRFGLILSSLTLTGCVSYQSERERVEADIPDISTLTQITLGETTSDWLVTQFGPPMAIRHTEATAIWQYQNVSWSTRRVRALPLFAVELKDRSRTVYHFEVENNHIVRYWQDAMDASN